MKRLILCFDGTWNTLQDPTALTNVVKLANLVTVNADGVDQITYYNSGVGSGGPIDRFLGGAFGVGLKDNVKRGLTFLALNYEAGDEIYLFGFSRGAYTARALAGVIGTAGIPRDISKTERHWTLYQQIAKLRPKPGLPKTSPARIAAEKAIEEIVWRLIPLSRNVDDEETRLVPVNIACIGVWDTVGSYGIPAGFGLTSLARRFTEWTRGFRNTHFGDAVRLGLHAIAIDERRRPFTPTFWTYRPKAPEEATHEKGPPVEQVWFSGVHSNVGGGYPDNGLSDLALAWMMARVEANTGLRFNEEEAMRMVWPCSASTLYHTVRYRWLNPAREILPSPHVSAVWERIRRLTGRRSHRRFARVNEGVHWSVKERCGWPDALVDKGTAEKYRPSNLREDITAYSVPAGLERKLLDHSARTWGDNCPLRSAKRDCLCAARNLHAMSGAASAPGGSTPAS
jgi:uncharacterized protein (DUF2235 family)